MNHIKNHVKDKFTLIPNELINEKSINRTARFLFVYLASKPDGWKFNTKELAKGIGTCIETFRKHRDKLILSGWIIVEKQNISKGKFDSKTYHILSRPFQEIDKKASELEKILDEKNSSNKNSDEKKKSDVENTQLINNNSKKEKKEEKNIPFKSKTKKFSFNANPRENNE